MKKIASSLWCLSLAAVLGFSTAALADDPEICLDCHEPAEDWEGMSAEDIFAEAKNANIKRHADNLEIPDETLQAIIAELLTQ